MATGAKAKKKTVRLPAGLKRARQGIKLNAANSSLRSELRTSIKAAKKAVAAGDVALTTAQLKTTQATIDSIADKGIIHKNKASRHKSRLARAAKKIALAAKAKA